MKYDASGKLLEAEPHNREAKYRTQLRAAEAERDQLRERLDKRDRAEVEHMVSNRLIDPQPPPVAERVTREMAWLASLDPATLGQV